MGSRVDVMGYGHPTAVYITSNKTKVNTNKDKHDLMSEKYFARQVSPTLAAVIARQTLRRQLYEGRGASIPLLDNGWGDKDDGRVVGTLVGKALA